ncbi:MAG: hypothetical protein KG029_04595 [Bacteroidetes bacterium]|nr:hypothetical protein [Bacteroidota bacterium]
MTVTLVFLFKFGSEENIDNLLQHGTVYCNTVKYFREVDDNYTRGDENECKTYIKQIDWLKIENEGISLEFNTKAQLYVDDGSFNGNLYCMSAITRDDIDYSLINEDFKIHPITLNPSLARFGNSAMLIYNIPEFFIRLEKALKRKHKKYQYEPITYTDFNTYEGELSPFIKSIKYDYQKEFRIFIRGQSNKPFIVNIGNLTDIAIKVKSAEVVNGIAVGIGLPKK